MIIEQHPYINEEGKEFDNLIKQYSDANVMIEQVETGRQYSEAVDVYPCRYSYIETDIPVDEEKQRFV